MRIWVVIPAVVVAALSTTPARAQSRVSIEVGGAVSGYDLGSTPTGAARSGLSSASTTTMGTVAGVTMRDGAGNGIGVFEVRPTVVLEQGLLFAVGFRDGTAGFGHGSTNLVGGDLSIGYARRWGRLMPFAKAMFGFNTYDSFERSVVNPRQMDLRLDAVLGTRLYVCQRLYVSASAFAGLGDQYGGALAVGGDVLQIFGRGVLP